LEYTLKNIVDHCSNPVLISLGFRKIISDVRIEYSNSF
jgi:hypothetical protein